MSITLGQRVAAHFRASMSPDIERRHKEVMKAIQATDYKEWEHYKRAQEEAPEFWASEMARLEKEIEQANKDKDRPEDGLPGQWKLAKEEIEDGRWRLQKAATVVYTVLGIRPDTTMGLVLDALYTTTRIQKYFDETVPYFAATWGICAHALGGGTRVPSQPP